MKKFLWTEDSALGLGIYVTLLIGCWTIVVIFSVSWRIKQESFAKLHQAREIARSHLAKDLIIREWNINHGFVYAPVTAKHQPNHLLKLPDREISTPSGKTLTAINSSTMIRQIYELAADKLAYHGHLTSLTPLRKENAPDLWEQQALKEFESGTEEIGEIVSNNNELCFRLMRPLMATEQCLACHSPKDYTPGKVAGGISVTLPMASVVDAWQKTRLSVILAHGFLWLIGLLGLGFGAKQLQKKIKAKNEVETALRQSEKNFRLLVKNIPALVYRGYADGRVDFVDDKVEQLTGYSREQFFHGQIKWPEIILPEDREASKKIFLQALKSNGAYRREYRISRQDGEIIWLAERSQIVCNAHGRIDFISGVIFDVSLQKKMEISLKESEWFWRTLLEAVGVGLVVVDKANRCITEVNPQAVAMSGLPREQIIGLDYRHLFACSKKYKVNSINSGLQETCSEGELIKADGTMLPILKTVAPIEISEKHQLLISFVDITDQRKAEKALTMSNKYLQTAMAELGQTNKEIGLINNMVEMLQICQNLDESYPIIAQFTQELFPDFSGALYLLNSSNNLVTAVSQWGKTLTTEKIFNPPECWALRRGRPYLSGSNSINPFNPRCHHIAAEVRGSHYCIPLSAQGETLGLLYLEQTNFSREKTGVDGSANDFNHSLQKLARTLAEHISLSMANLKLRESLRQQAIRDPLTGLFNRRYLQETLDRELHRAQRKVTSLGVIMLDVDNFKNFNDTHGHEAGDQLLAILGRYLKDSIRAEDIACRYGGEEFILILPDICPEILRERAETIRAGVNNLQVMHRGNVLSGITISLGLSYFPQHGADQHTLIQTADAALYEAKKSGRNRVVMYGCQPQETTGVKAA